MSAENNLSHQVNQIADDLAERGFSIVDEFLSSFEVDQVLSTDEFKKGKLHFKKAGIGKDQSKQIIEQIRGDYIQWIDVKTASTPVATYIQRIQEIIPLLNQNLFLSLKDAEVHMTFYPPGSFYKRHLDQFKSDDHRKLSIICYLNHDWKVENGGQLRIYLPDGPMDILPLAGRLVCFRSDLIEHEVLPADRERLSLTGWIVDRVITW